ncbi:P2X purinoceptor 7-like [Ranitomeya imitator]|uniref:P2X purinoceptor 7-like n=1 Tax=Ranitomeya imitator TaxID=111125 RepID=UPI0037E898F0
MSENENIEDDAILSAGPDDQISRCQISSLIEEVGSLTWCQCANCISLPTEMESVCCKEIEKVTSVLQGRACITEHPFFKVLCQNETSVNVMLRIIHLFPPPAAEKNRYLRQVCYRCFSAWIYGYRTERDERPIPACVVHKVRSAFPSLQNVFTGFRFTGDPPAESMVSI